MSTQILEADLTWTGDAFESGVRVAVDERGMIEAVGAMERAATVRLEGRALLPGFVNVHSHAFQRGLRGRGETFPPDGRESPGNFWSWRDAMYRLVEGLTEESIHALSRRAFLEMRLAGITAVGEFHYVHHDDTGAGYAFDAAVLEAARGAGIRIVLLDAFYHSGGLSGGRHVPLTGGQRRFATRSLDEYWSHMDRLRGMLDPATQSLGAVAHSVRAVPLEMMRELHAESARRRLPFHIHVEEQVREIEECRARYGKAPMALLNEHLEIDERTTAVHCTHTDAGDMSRYVASGGNVCYCPLTEANLGDGIADPSRVLQLGGNVGIGTDSNARIGMIEEMRQLEYVQRLAHRRRGVLADERGRLAERLVAAATEGGARCLDLPAGRVEPGCVADFVLLDLTAPSLAGWTTDTLAASLVFGAADDAVAGTWVAGTYMDREEIEDEARELARGA